MDLSAIGKRIKEARERKHMTQEELAELTDLSPTHISVIERGVKMPKLDTFIVIANELGVSADTLLQDVVEMSVEGSANELTASVLKLPENERRKILKVFEILTE